MSYTNTRLYMHLQAFVHMYVYIYIHKYSYIYLHISQNYLLTYALSLVHSLFPLNVSVCLPLTLFHGFLLEVCAPYYTLFNT